MFEIENLDKLNNLKANTNNINLDTQNQVYEMRYNTDMANATEKMLKYVQLFSLVFVILTIFFIGATAKSYFDNNQNYILLGLSISTLIASVTILLKTIDLHLLLDSHLRKSLIIQEKLINQP
ncbi:hypothetical protein [Psychrobacter immobilis]|uniref:hypothetical protein n=1 Tax=Psychrobacter immobilis TaxID=498 RepID=UPI003FD307C0